MTEIGRRIVGVTLAVALLSGSFLAVYLPAFGIVGALHLTVNQAVPAIIMLTLLAAVLLILGIARRKALPIAAFGFRTGDKRYIAYAVALGLPLSVFAAVLLDHCREPGPLAGVHIAPWLTIAYFGPRCSRSRRGDISRSTPDYLRYESGVSSSHYSKP